MVDGLILIIIIIPCIGVSCIVCACIAGSINKNNRSVRIQPGEDPPRIKPPEEDPIEAP